MSFLCFKLVLLTSINVF